MSEKRKDKRGRLLRTGETQDPVTGEYRFSYYENGKKQNFRSWRLNPTDPLPDGKRPGLSLREKEEQYQEGKRKGIKFAKGNITVNELVELYFKTRVNSRLKKSTRQYYENASKVLSSNEFGKRKIKNVTTSSAIEWMVSLQKSGNSYAKLYGVRSVLRSAFRIAVQDGWLYKNPFDDFTANEILVNDSSKRDAISPEDEKRFLDFIKNHRHYRKYYEAIYILFNTGMRISEFCGLTLDDLDFDKRTITINKQLQKVGSEVFVEHSAKTKSGNRVIPMEDGVYEAFKVIVENRKKNPRNPTVNGISNFLYIDRTNKPMVAKLWDGRFSMIEMSYNDIHKDSPLPHITPHVCRHTYCSKKAKAGMNPAQLAYLMGHSSINVTLGVYTHVRYEDALAELRRIGSISEAV